MGASPTFTAFAGSRRHATGDLSDIARAATRPDAPPVLVFDDASGRVVDLELRHGPDGAVAEYEARAKRSSPPGVQKGRGRPRLGVVAREVTLLPRHWDWLAQQPGGASAALRRLVEEARRTSAGPDRRRAAQEAAYRVMTTLAGDLPAYEDAVRALYAGDAAAFAAHMAPWPPDISDYVQRLAGQAFAPPAGAEPAAGAAG
ncbi:MAG: DUF2239 family protein [Phenylobacterium sp.]|uniref:DUF2239 family protein n=1 Tax=Phenylobacterium sp. TaxID=1871053 RepID=UPI001A51EA9D|nr:DUF2239 family protein [Phenylobacterium sp.]MBL8770325.1 DUF2239 family protein [Phenylobacterium sp.]